MTWTIREGRIEEVDQLVALRRAMFEGMGRDNPEVLTQVVDASWKYFTENMPTGLFRVWVACALDSDEAGVKRAANSNGIGTCVGEPIASIGLVVHSAPPRPSNLVGKTGYIMNLVTLPTWRRRGIARALLAHVIEVLRAEGVPMATLHASKEGRELYEEMGFELRDALPEMALRLA